MDVAQKIKDYMKQQGIAQASVCRKTGISASKFNLAVNGKRKFTFEEYEMVCWALDVGVEKFLEPKAPESA